MVREWEVPLKDRIKKVTDHNIKKDADTKQHLFFIIVYLFYIYSIFLRVDLHTAVLLKSDPSARLNPVMWTVLRVPEPE